MYGKSWSYPDILGVSTFQIETLAAFEWQSAMLSADGTRMVWHSPLTSSLISRIIWYFNLVCLDLAEGRISLAATVAASLSPSV